MAEIQDIDGEVGEIEAVEEQLAEPTPAAEVPSLPEQYRGKSVEDIVKMHQEAEKLIARQGREVGEVRKLADELIKSQLTPKPKVEEVAPVDFFENPQEAIRQQIENHPRVREAEQTAKQLQADHARQRLNQMHPDVANIVQDSGFQDWIKASKVRTKLFQDAEAYDVVKQQQVAKVDTTARDQSLKAASVDTGGSGETTRKVYRRADLIRLKMRDPSKYESMSDEIMTAYSEGRVK